MAEGSHQRNLEDIFCEKELEEKQPLAGSLPGRGCFLEFSGLFVQGELYCAVENHGILKASGVVTAEVMNPV